MRILFVTSGNKNSKPKILVQQQSDSLIKAGIEIDFFLIKGRNIKGYLANVAPLIHHVKNNKYDIIHSHFSFSAFVSTLGLWFVKGKPHVVSLMGSDVNSKRVFRYFITYFSSKFWNKTIVKSKVMLEEISLSKTEVIPNGVDVLKIKKIEIELSNLKKPRTPGKENSILFVGNPDRESKNFTLAKNAADLANQKIITIFNKSHSDVILELLKADLLLLTSKWEGSSNIIKEAMACNLPIVATDVGDVRWLFGNEPGYFVSNNEPIDVADKMKQGLDYSKKFGRTNGRQRILELSLDSDSVAEKLIEVYQRVLIIQHE